MTTETLAGVSPPRKAAKETLTPEEVERAACANWARYRQAVNAKGHFPTEQAEEHELDVEGWARLWLQEAGRPPCWCRPPAGRIRRVRAPREGC